MSSYVEDLRKIEKTKGATFTLEGVIAARSPENGQRTHDAIQHICSTIIEAYRNANDGTTSLSEKQAAILKVVELKGDLDWLATFTLDESEHCRYPAHSQGMKKVADIITQQVHRLKADFEVLRADINTFQQIFDTMLSVLEQMTEFFKQGHAAEISHVIEQGKNAYAECKNLSNIEVPSLLVPQSKLVKDRVEDFLKKCRNLVNIQEGTNQSLRDRVENVDLLLQAAIPDFILKSKDHLVNMGQPHHQSIKDEQIEAYGSVIACLDEINRILERIKVKYTNAFDEDGIKAHRDLDDLDKAANDLFRNLAKLKAPARSDDEPSRLAAAENVPTLTKTTMAAMTERGATPEQRKDLINVVKQARDGTIPEYFEAADKMESLISKVREQPDFQISAVPNLPVPKDEGPKDMLEAAKAMCAALKSLNFSLDQ